MTENKRVPTQPAVTFFRKLLGIQNACLALRRENDDLYTITDGALQIVLPITVEDALRRQVENKHKDVKLDVTKFGLELLGRAALAMISYWATNDIRAVYLTNLMYNVGVNALNTIGQEEINEEIDQLQPHL